MWDNSNITFLQPSVNSNSSLLLNAEETPGLSTPQASTSINKTVNNLKVCSHKEINNNTNNDESLPKKHQQTVRFIAGHKNGKSKLKSSVELAASEESILSDASFAKHPSSYGNPQHVRMMVNSHLRFFCFSCLVHTVCLIIFATHFLTTKTTQVSLERF